MNIGTMIYTWLRGDHVGVDEFDNHYYHSTKDKRYGREKRWVLYRGRAEATTVPPEWHAWLHHMSDAPLMEKATQSKDWQKEHQPNLTGTPEAYRPQGHDYKGGAHAPSRSDYEAWRPE
jgi:NADH:ubiquinone oxidoreductase subunit